MRLLPRKHAINDPHLPLSVMPWGELRSDGAPMSRAAAEAGKHIAEEASLHVDDLEKVVNRPPVHRQLRTLIPGLLPLGGFPANPDEVAFDFATGWLAADAEERWGLARPNMISKSAQMALSLLRIDPDSQDFSPASWQFLDLGYCTNRLGVEPEVVLRRCVYLMRRDP